MPVSLPISLPSLQSPCHIPHFALPFALQHSFWVFTGHSYQVSLTNLLCFVGAELPCWIMGSFARHRVCSVNVTPSCVCQGANFSSQFPHKPLDIRLLWYVPWQWSHYNSRRPTGKATLTFKYLPASTHNDSSPPQQTYTSTSSNITESLITLDFWANTNNILYTFTVKICLLVKYLNLSGDIANLSSYQLG